ncbi:hypothetical protein RSAG8_04317, partial [Rhizoctonia solani AG-8 WAC10335]
MLRLTVSHLEIQHHILVSRASPISVARPFDESEHDSAPLGVLNSWFVVCSLPSGKPQVALRDITRRAE